MIKNVRFWVTFKHCAFCVVANIQKVFPSVFSQARIKEGKREKFRAWPIASAKLTLDSYKQRQTSGSEQPHLIKSPPPVLYYCSLAKNPQLSKMTLCKTFLRFSLPSLALQGTIKIFNFFSDYIYVRTKKGVHALGWFSNNVLLIKGLFNQTKAWKWPFK